MDTKAEVARCGSPCPKDPTWACTRAKGHPPDWHAIFLFSGSIAWRAKGVLSFLYRVWPDRWKAWR